jgi:hypothetical protein
MISKFEQMRKKRLAELMADDDEDPTQLPRKNTPKKFWSPERPTNTASTEVWRSGPTNAHTEKVCYELAEPFRNEKEEREFILEQMKYCQHIKQIPAQLEILFKYKGSDYRSINSALRNARSYNSINNLDDLLNAAPRFSFPIYVHRLVRMFPGVDLVNDVLLDKGYKSTSLKSSTCFGFGFGERKQVFLHIKIPHGKPVYFFENCNFGSVGVDFGYHRDLDESSETFNYRKGFQEAEILLGRNVTFQPVLQESELLQQYNDFMDNDAIVMFIKVNAIFN